MSTNIETAARTVLRAFEERRLFLGAHNEAEQDIEILEAFETLKKELAQKPTKEGVKMMRCEKAGECTNTECDARTPHQFGLGCLAANCLEGHGLVKCVEVDA